VIFVRGSLRVPLKPFFSLTSAVLLLIALQLLVGGLHELSEAQVLPSSRAEMALVGPIIKNELLLFTLTVALPAGWLLFGPLEGGAARFDAGACRDGHLHFYEVDLPEGAVRFFAIQVGQELRTCLDACEICGDKGYFESSGSVVCRNCTSPIVLSSLGRTGGC